MHWPENKLSGQVTDSLDDDEQNARVRRNRPRDNINDREFNYYPIGLLISKGVSSLSLTINSNCGKIGADNRRQSGSPTHLYSMHCSTCHVVVVDGGSVSAVACLEIWSWDQTDLCNIIIYFRPRQTSWNQSPFVFVFLFFYWLVWLVGTHSVDHPSNQLNNKLSLEWSDWLKDESVVLRIRLELEGQWHHPRPFEVLSYLHAYVLLFVHIQSSAVLVLLLLSFNCKRTTRRGTICFIALFTSKSVVNCLPEFLLPKS